MDVSTLLDCNGLLALWRHMAATVGSGRTDWCELNEHGEMVTNPRPSARRQIALTDVYCDITGQIGHLAAMSVAVTTPSFGIRVPDVVWMPCERWESFDRDEPVPFVPDLCVEVLLDSDRAQDIGRRVNAYLEGGAREVMVVGQHGQVEIWGTTGRRRASIFGVTLSLDPMYFEEIGVSSVLSVRCSTGR
ncbi:Uma2 family endonuclease [Paraburkholderia sediminicola]|uniref:Uma2 family endonuclease n=1 Tax=Paraburkholderia sediminicola TaxID=458836 RepID=UPI0038BDAD54